MSKFKEYTVQDVISLVIDYRGKTPKKLGGDWSENGYRALSAKNVKTGKIVQPDTIRFVSEDMYHKWMKDEVEKGDIFITSEAPFGQIYYWDSEEKIILSQRLFAVRTKKGFYDKYIYFYMTNPLFQAELENRSTGTTVTGLRQPELLKTKVIAPDYETQVKIADFLYEIEKKININEAINRNLSDQLQAVYLERFSENLNGTLADLCEYSKARTDVDALTPETYYSTENMLPNKMGSTAASGLPTTGKTPKCVRGDVLISNIRPYFKKIVYCYEDAGCSADVLCFSAKEERLSPYVYATLYVDKFFDYMVVGSKGTKMPRGDKQQIMMYPVHIPTDTERKEFFAIAIDMLKMINVNRIENKWLEDLRNSLLPKLISGELDVSDLDI